MPETQAVILAAGKGGRLKGLLGDKPKCMAVLGDKTIVEHQISALRSAGVGPILMVVGYQKEMLTAFVGERFDRVQFVFNDIFESTNTIYSLHLAMPFIKDDFFFCNGDVLFGPSLPARLAAEANTGLAVEYKACGDEEVKVLLDGRRITQISKQVPCDRAAGEFIGVALFRKPVLEAFRNSLAREVEEKGIVKDYFERALDLITSEVELYAVDITGEPVIEIDFPEDLERAVLLAKALAPRG